jgi:hypothetical protein
MDPKNELKGWIQALHISAVKYERNYKPNYIENKK